MAHAAANAEPAPVNGIKIWYAVFGRGTPVICSMVDSPMPIIGASWCRR
jgi:hypothetical protein